MRGSSHMLRYGRVRSSVIHNYFALYGRDVIRAYWANKAERQ